MLLRNLELLNFGTYGGKQNVDLGTVGSANIILFGGKNGAGKSTLLEAVRLCFYGHLSDRGLFARDRYERYLDERIHRDSRNVIQPKLASVGVEFEYGEQDGLHIYRIVRSWERRHSNRVAEDFELYKDGRPVTDISADHWQDFVRDLIPPGVSDLFFFDGERIQDLADGAHDQQTLSEAVKNLLGADLIERLQADLAIYRTNILKASAETRDGDALRVMEQAVRETQEKLDSALRDAEESDQVVLHLRERASAVEAELASAGGGFSRHRSGLEEERAKLAGAKLALEQQVRDIAHGLLPISVTPRLATALLEQLERERAVGTNEELRVTLRKRSRACLRKLSSLSVGRGRTLKESDLYSKIAAVVSDAFELESVDCPRVHSISESQLQQIKVWVSQAIADIPSRMKALADELEKLYRREQVIERGLARVPQSDLIKPLIEALNDAYREIAEATTRAGSRRALADSLRNELDEQLIACRKLSQAIAGRIAQREAVERASRIQEALSEYKTVLIERKLAALQSIASEYFNLLSHKKEAHRRVCINPVTFDVTVLDSQDRGIRKQELSAGEKQIYAVSMLWALAKVSGRPLPMIIDTPLARLDCDHRALLSQYYFPQASHQILILSTDTEVETRQFELLRPSVARAYELRFLPEHNRTEILPGYFGEGVN
jgi:DNA sulfur modification protein DndD